MQVSVDPDALCVQSARVANVAESFAGTAARVRTGSSAAAAGAGVEHAATGIREFGVHWDAVLRVLAAAAGATADGLVGAAHVYATVETTVARAATGRPP